METESSLRCKCQQSELSSPEYHIQTVQIHSSVLSWGNLNHMRVFSSLLHPTRSITATKLAILRCTDNHEAEGCVRTINYLRNKIPFSYIPVFVSFLLCPVLSCQQSFYTAVILTICESLLPPCLFSYYL